MHYSNKTSNTQNRKICLTKKKLSFINENEQTYATTSILLLLIVVIIVIICSIITNQQCTRTIICMRRSSNDYANIKFNKY